MSALLKTAEEIIESVKEERDWFKWMLEKRDTEVERLRVELSMAEKKIEGLRAELAQHYKISSGDEKYIFDREAQ